MIKFPTQYRKHEIFSTKSGDPVVPVYKLYIDETTGVKDLKVYSKKNIYDEIQADALQCDINYIIKRFVNGDASVLNKKPGVFTDASEMPTTLAEMYQKVLDGEQYFNGLPAEVKNQFNNSASQFFTQFGTERWNKVFDDYNSSLSERKNVQVNITTPEQKEVISNEE